MEAAMGGASSIDGDWESICRMLSIDQEPDFTNLLGNTSNYDQLPADHNQGVISLLMAGDASPIPSLHELGGTRSCFNVDQHAVLTPTWNNNHSQLSCSSDDHLSSFSSFIGFHADQDDFLMNEANVHTNKDPMENADELKIQHEVPLPKKRVRVSKDALKGKRKARAKKSKNGGVHEEEEKSSDCYVLDDESNDSREEMKDGSKLETLKSDIGKKRTGRGEATDPQSLYARRRRERINERLKILQTLVPNGTKVDISTMLEEAVHYVKFLQMQIKLLSSEELWMYAPLAYNGFDVGLYNNFSPYLLP